MNKNHVERHGKPDKLARDSKVQSGSKQSHVNVARVRGKIPNLIRGGLLEGGQKSAAAIVVGGVTTTQGGRETRLQGEGPNGKELNRKEQANLSSRHLGGKKAERTWREG